MDCSKSKKEFIMFDISSIINTQAIPVFLLPLNGLLCTVFYNRFTNISNRLHLVQRYQKDLLKGQKTSKDKLFKKDLQQAEKHLVLLHQRSRLMLLTLVCLLISVLSFCVCAVLITLTIKDPKYFRIALTTWFLGPFTIMLGISFALVELLLSLKSIKLYNPTVQDVSRPEANQI